jgi:hypothetical protein
MDHIGINLHNTSGQVCILTKDGEPIMCRINTDKESFDKLFAQRASSSRLATFRTLKYFSQHYPIKLCRTVALFETFLRSLMLNSPDCAVASATRKIS